MLGSVERVMSRSAAIVNGLDKASEGHRIDLDPELALAVEEIDRSLIQLALERSPFERLRAGVAMAKLAARFRREPSEGR
jgi:hypothetical protein